MKRYNEPIGFSSAADALPPDHVRLAASAYLARFTGSSREHTESDRRCYLRWCADRGLDPVAARRPDLEQYIGWMQEACRFKPKFPLSRLADAFDQVVEPLIVEIK